MNSKKFHDKVAQIPFEVHQNVSRNMDILDRLHELLNKKFDGKQNLLAETMGKTTPEISKWFSGLQNFTLKTITKLEVAFGEKILSVVMDAKEDTTYESVACHHNENAKSLQVDPQGIVEEKEFVPFKKPHTNKPEGNIIAS